MVTVPAWVWRFGPVLRAVIAGVVAGAFFGALAWIDSGFLLAAAIVFVVLGIGFGASMGWLDGVVGVEVFWWAGRHDRLLDNADQAAAQAAQAARAEEIDD